MGVEGCTVHVYPWYFARRLRAAIVQVVWSRRQSLANPGAVLSLLVGSVTGGNKWSVKYDVRDLGGSFRYYLSWMVCYPGFWGSVGYRSSGFDFCPPSGFLMVGFG